MVGKTTKGILQMALATIAGALACTLFFLFVVSGAFAVLMPNPSRPQITYGEFPIRVIFELDGEIQTIEDTVIAEFTGFESLGTAGRYRVWTSRLKSGNERLVLLRVENEGLVTEISVFSGLPDSYMGDFTWRSRWEHESSIRNVRFFGYIQWENDDLISGITISPEEVWEKYNLRVIEVQHSPSIENTFGWRRFIPRWFLSSGS
ncbi:MAG: hypothetical protein FWC66_05005 [Oscillospiraceae bacterium]|nr:hypothetical protein [Oscillospiraceae bacterium]